MQSNMPWFETAEEATHNAIQHSDKSPKEVAYHLWPHMKPESAYARLMGALNTERPEKLSADEHICIARHCGNFDFLYYVAAQCHHSRPEPIEPADEAMELDREINRSLKAVEQLLRRRERVNIKAVSTG